MSHSTGCTHCGDTDDHVHLDPFEHARSRRRQLLHLVVSRAMVTVVALVVLAVLLPPVALAGGLAAGLVLWAVSTAAGVLVSTLLLARLGRLRALMYGALLAAALIPALAAVTARMDSAGTFAAAVAVGYLAGSYGAESVRLGRLRTLLGQDTRAGEVARDSAAITHDQDHDLTDLLATAGMALLVGCYVYLTGLLAILTVVLVPLHVAIVALRRRQAVRQHRAPRVAPLQRADS